MRFKDRVVLVTGAASGIGRATALLFAAEQARLIATDISKTNLKSLEDELHRMGHSDALFFQGDLASVEEVRRLASEAIANAGPIDVLCNVAGVLDRWMLAHEVTDDVWSQVIAVNLTAPALLSREVLPSMIARRRGVIVTVSSTAGLGGGRAGVAYTVAKHGAIGLGQNLAISYAEFGIRSVVICPGAVSQSTGAVAGPVSELGTAMVARLTATRPEVAAPGEIAKVVLFAASDEASHINGATIVVDGGWSVY